VNGFRAPCVSSSTLTEPRRLRVASRGSPLALWQANHVAAALRAAGSELSIEVVVISTEGDRRHDVPLAEIGGKGVFVKEVQAAVLDGRADLAVHSAKDLPAVTPIGLVLACVPERADASDALVGRALGDIPEGGIIATGSPRRAIQLLALRPDLMVVGLRGNIDARLAKAKDNDAVVVATAALVRLGHTDRIAQVFNVDEMVPQVGQGALAVECRSGDDELMAMLQAIEHATTRRCVDAERAFLSELGGDCDLPAGAHGVVTPQGLRFRAVLGGEMGVIRRFDEVAEDGQALGVAAARRLRV
jgi:hydroxymethylbilane synthase